MTNIYIYIYTAQVQIWNIISQRIWLQTKTEVGAEAKSGVKSHCVIHWETEMSPTVIQVFLPPLSGKSYYCLCTVFILWASECVCWCASVCLMLHRSHVKYCVCISAKQSKEQLKKGFLNILLSSQSKSINLKRAAPTGSCNKYFFPPQRGN